MVWFIERAGGGKGRVKTDPREMGNFVWRTDRKERSWRRSSSTQHNYRLIARELLQFCFYFSGRAIYEFTTLNKGNLAYGLFAAKKYGGKESNT